MEDELTRMSGTLKKLKTLKKKFFVLKAGGSNAGPRLEYYDSEKKFKTDHKAKRSILLQSCINISKRPDSKHKHAVIMFIKDDSFGLVFDSDKEQNAWLKAMLALQAEIGITKQRYDHVWEVQVKEKGLTNLKCLTAGTYRMYLTNKNLGFLRVNQEECDMELPLATIRSCGHADNFFNLEIGSAAATGAAAIWMQVEDAVIAQNMHEIVLSTMKSSSRDTDMKPPQMFRTRSHSSAVDSKQRTASLRRSSASVGESSTLPRNIKAHRQSDAHNAHNTPTKRRSTYSHSRDSGIHSVSLYGELGSRSRTDSVSSHGSHRTDHSAHSSDVEADSFNGDHSHGSGKLKGRRDKSRKSYFDDFDDRANRQKDIMVSPSPETGSDLTDGSSYMEMGTNQRPRTRASQSESTYFAMMGTSPANSTASAGGESESYFEMSGRVVAARPSEPRRLDGGYMEMTSQVSRSRSVTLRPDKVCSLLADDGNYEGLDDFPPRANSVGSKPSVLLRGERLNDTYMDMSQGGHSSQSSVGKAQDKCLSAPHLPDHCVSTNPQLRNSSRGNSPSVRSNDSSRSTTPRSGTPSQHLDSDLMELDFRSGSHESLSDFRSRASSAGSRDFYSSGFGSHDIRDRTGSTGSRDSMTRFHEGHRPRTATIGQETLRPRTSSFGPADMRPRAASYGTKYKDLSRRVKEKQLRLQEPKGKLLGSSSRDSVGSGGPGKHTDLAISRTRGQEYRATLAPPAEEYMTLAPSHPSTSPASFCTPPRSFSSHLHSTPSHESHLKSAKHVHMSPEVQMFADLPNHGSKRHSYRKDRGGHGSSSESLSSSSSDMGHSLKSKHSSRAKKASAVASLSKTPPAGDNAEYIDASPQTVSALSQREAEDSYCLYEPGQGPDRSPKSSFSGLEKVISPIRDDISLSTFQIVSPIKEEDNDALFGPKPKRADKETPGRLRDLKHEYVNVDFDGKKSGQEKNTSIKEALSGSDQSGAKDTSLDTEVSLGYHSNVREHDYMEIDISNASSTGNNLSRTGQSSLDMSGSSKSSDSHLNEQSEKNSKYLSVGSEKSGLLEPSRFHDYCEINFDDAATRHKTGSGKSNLPSVPDPFGELSPQISMSASRDSKNMSNTMVSTAVKPVNEIKTSAENNNRSPKSPTVISSSSVTKDSSQTSPSVPDPFVDPPLSAQTNFSSQVGEEASGEAQATPSPVTDIFDIGAKPSGTVTSAKAPSEQCDTGRRASPSGGSQQRDALKSSSGASDALKSTSGVSSLPAGQTSLCGQAGSKIHTSCSSTSLDAMAKSREGSSALDSPRSRHSYHEIIAFETSVGARQSSRTSLNSDMTSTPQLNYARLDLTTSTDEPGINVISREGQMSPTGSLPRSASFSVQAEDGTPISYAQIDFEKSEQLKQMEQRKEPEVASQTPKEQVKEIEQAPPFECI